MRFDEFGFLEFLRYFGIEILYDPEHELNLLLKAFRDIDKDQTHLAKKLLSKWEATGVTWKNEDGIVMDYFLIEDDTQNIQQDAKNKAITKQNCATKPHSCAIED